MSEDKALLDVKDIARLLGVSTAAVYKLRVSGKLPPYIQIGNRFRWRAAEIHEWIAAERSKNVDEVSTHNA